MEQLFSFGLWEGLGLAKVGVGHEKPDLQCQGGNNDIIINISQNFVMTLSHDVCDGVGDHLISCRAMDPAKHDPRIQEILIIPSKSQTLKHQLDQPSDF